MVRVDPHNPRAAALAERLAAYFDVETLPDSLCLVVGGDGWMLRCIRELGAGPTYLGLNAGHLGFLLNDADDVADVALVLTQRSWTVTSFPRLGMRGLDPHGRPLHTLAVNDLYVERGTGQSAHLHVKIDGVPMVDRLICDGLLVATALGSTAYSYSAGGPPCHPQVRAVMVTPVCPHAPRLPPLVLPPEAVVEIDVLSPERRPVRAVADGVELGPITSARLQLQPDEVRLAFLSEAAFTRRLLRKVLRT